ncbi:hypothetical protein LPE01_19160 [Lactiplantibacillus pentosus]|nr:hypothetical protein LPE01_19160 [Lactiplantibacillus pentosus]
MERWNQFLQRIQASYGKLSAYRTLNFILAYEIVMVGIVAFWDIKPGYSC